ncbi:hypothetical protein BS78_03G021000 [Paspalum vaginatum]|nr:hypothetical protein BS78_03G021000 [Paspalum vaginatum]KAJ1282057.1 hypothetical protein BS78_03G021000 [Paspalum vaginatum]KAJ1282058.1 hypothetical protein BS78_03G021000 [Paspalum vaginatum]KAJ1282059.1 hypothetical protein BS78_03G021000 [Paspalum vaginatum]KAJ1282060.1 hypothetical protein BS78_03G021000 [Paspalum vaginatum]
MCTQPMFYSLISVMTDGCFAQRITVIFSHNRIRVQTQRCKGLPSCACQARGIYETLGTTSYVEKQAGISDSGFTSGPLNIYCSNRQCDFSCGLFIMKYMELWDGSKLQKKFGQKDVDKFRKELVADLIFLEANEIQEAKEAVEDIMNRNKY